MARLRTLPNAKNVTGSQEVRGFESHRLHQVVIVRTPVIHMAGVLQFPGQANEQVLI